MSECSDCGRPASAVLVLGFSCGRERSCPLMRQCADCGYPLGDKPVFLGGVWFYATCNPALSEKSPACFLTRPTKTPSLDRWLFRMPATMAPKEMNDGD